MKKRDIKKKGILLFVLILFFAMYKIYYKLTEKFYGDLPTAVAISSSGKYAATVSYKNELALWDLKNQDSKLISTQANFRTIAFVPHSNNFIWQDKNTFDIKMGSAQKNIQNLFPLHKQISEHLISNDLKTYVASNTNWDIFTVISNKEKMIKQGFEGKFSGKNLTLSLHNNILLSSGLCYDKYDDIPISKGATLKDIFPKITDYANRSFMNCIVLWDINTGKALRKFNGNSVKTHATLSPDGKYVVSVDENDLGYIWSKDGQRIGVLYDLVFGKYDPDQPETDSFFDNSDLIPMPKDFCWQRSHYPYRCESSHSAIAVKFINNSQFLRFTDHVPYAILYDVTSPRHKKYLKLEGDPSVVGFNAPSFISTAPDKNLLVMGSVKDEGIRVYQFDPKEETLKLVWAPTEINRTFKQKMQRLWQKLIA